MAMPATLTVAPMPSHLSGAVPSTSHRHSIATGTETPP